MKAMPPRSSAHRMATDSMASWRANRIGQGPGQQRLAVLAGLEGVGDAVDGGRVGLHLRHHPAALLGGPLAGLQEPLDQPADDAQVGRGEGELEPDVAGDLDRVEGVGTARR